MVRRALCVAVAAFLLAALGGLIATPSALALGGSGSDNGPGKPTNPGPTNSGSTGAPVQGTVKSCSLYATSSSFGLSCLSGGSGHALTVKQILGHTPAPTCWDTLVPVDQLQSRYGYPENTDAPYYVLSCISGLDVNKSLYDQPGLNLSQKLVEIKKGAGGCPRPFTPQQESGDDLSCVMTLIGKQTQVTNYLATNDADIPSIVLATYPSTVVRTQQATAFVDRGRCSGCSSGDRTADHSAGGVTMFAKMTSFRILPFGPGGVSKTCDGTADVTSSDTPATKPDACWYTYTRSSQGQPGSAYPFRAEATWTVYVQTGGATKPFATFHKYSDIQLPVVDVQTDVIPGN